MSNTLKRITFWGSLTLLVAIGLGIAFRPQAVVVDMIEVARGELVVTADDEGRTRVHDIYALSAPVAGHMRRVDLHVGDPVVGRETVVAEIEKATGFARLPRSASSGANIVATVL